MPGSGRKHRRRRVLPAHVTSYRQFYVASSFKSEHRLGRAMLMCALLFIRECQSAAGNRFRSASSPAFSFVLSRVSSSSSGGLWRVKSNTEPEAFAPAALQAEEMGTQ